jgi:hypothetical protein
VKISAAKLSALASLVTISGGLYAAYQYFLSRRVDGSVALTRTESIKSVNSVAVLPASDPTGPGWSDYARRLDLETLPDIADQPIPYGLTVPQ